MWCFQPDPVSPKLSVRWSHTQHHLICDYVNVIQYIGAEPSLLQTSGTKIYKEK